MMLLIYNTHSPSCVDVILFVLKKQHFSNIYENIILAINQTCAKTLHIFTLIFNKYKTFSVLIYSYINTSGNWENEKLCGNTTPEGRSVFTQFRVFPISTSVDITVYINTEKNVLYLFYNIAQRNINK
jgi:hypothetical protein